MENEQPDPFLQVLTALNRHEVRYLVRPSGYRAHSG